MQEPDIIILEGTKQLSLTYPYDSYLASMYAAIKFDSITDTCKRGYIATWEVRDDILHLNGLDAVFQSKSITDDRQAMELLTFLVQIVKRHYSYSVFCIGC